MNLTKRCVCEQCAPFAGKNEETIKSFWRKVIFLKKLEPKKISSSVVSSAAMWFRFLLKVFGFRSWWGDSDQQQHQRQQRRRRRRRRRRQHLDKPVSSVEPNPQLKSNKTINLVTVEVPLAEKNKNKNKLRRLFLWKCCNCNKPN